MNQLKEKIKEFKLQKKFSGTVFLNILIFSVVFTLICFIFYQKIQLTIKEEKILKSIELKTEIEKLKQENIKLNRFIEDLNIENDSFFNKKIRLGFAEQKIAYLTFDDGPSENTEKILNVLLENNVKATFFIVGRDNEYYRGLYTRMINEGHIIAPHSYSHKYNEIYSSYESFVEDQTKLMNLILSLGVKNPYIMRLPGGSGTDLAKKYGNDSLMYQILSHYVSIGYKYFDWNVDSKDATVQSLSVEQIENNVVGESLKLITPIILMHDSPAKKTTPLALQKIITRLKEAGYNFDALSVSVKPVVQKEIS